MGNEPQPCACRQERVESGLSEWIEYGDGIYDSSDEPEWGCSTSSRRGGGWGVYGVAR